MTTTKPPRIRQQTIQPRTAPTYKRLGHDAYAALDELEKRRHDMHIDVDAIIDAWPYAKSDSESVGLRASGAGTGGSASYAVKNDDGTYESVDATGVEILAARHAAEVADKANEWVAQAVEARAHITRLANLARYLYGFDPKRGRPEQSRPAQKPDPISDMELCAFCEQPCPSGRDENGKPLIRRIDEQPVHTSPCYSTLASQALRAGRSVKAHLQTLHNTHNSESAGR